MTSKWELFATSLGGIVMSLISIYVVVNYPLEHIVLGLLIATLVGWIIGLGIGILFIIVY